MPVKTFMYTKDGKDPEQRTLAVLNAASDSDFGIDITELDEDAKTAFIEEFEHELEEHKQLIADLMYRFDLKHKFRRFKTEKMTDI